MESVISPWLKSIQCNQRGSIANIPDQGILITSYYFSIAVKQNSIIIIHFITQQKTVALLNKSQGVVFYVSLFLRQGAEPSTPTMCALG